MPFASRPSGNRAGATAALPSLIARRLRRLIGIAVVEPPYRAPRSRGRQSAWHGPDRDGTGIELDARFRIHQPAVPDLINRQFLLHVELDQDGLAVGGEDDALGR